MDTSTLRHTISTGKAVSSLQSLKVGIVEVTSIYILMQIMVFAMVTSDLARDALSFGMILFPVLFFILCYVCCHRSKEPFRGSSGGDEGLRPVCPQSSQVNDTGFHKYLRHSLGDYLTESELTDLDKVITNVRIRTADSQIKHIATAITDRKVLSAIRVETKVLKKYNLYAFMHNMCGYLNITRLEAAELLKALFPGVFEGSKVSSIDKSLTAEKNIRKLEIPYLESNTVSFFLRHINSL